MHRSVGLTRSKVFLAAAGLVLAACGIGVVGAAEPAPPPDRTDAPVDADVEAEADPQADASDGAVDAGPKVPCTEPGAKTLGDHCYFPIGAQSQTEAATTCLASGGHLATVNSLAEHELLKSVGTGDRWIGLRAPSPTNDRQQYVWVTGEPVTVTYWYVNDPDNMGPCVALHGSIFEWVDRGCEGPYPAICERE